MISIPRWLESALTSGTLNMRRGDWITWGPVVIPPFSWTPGNTIFGGVTWLSQAIDGVLTIAREGWTWAQDGLRAARSALASISDWLRNAGRVIRDNVTTWWQATWPQVSTAINGVVERLRVGLDTLRGSLTSWVEALFAQVPGVVAGLLDPFRPSQEFYDTHSGEMNDLFGDKQSWFSTMLTVNIGSALSWFLQRASWPFLRALEGFLVEMWDRDEDE